MAQPARPIDYTNLDFESLRDSMLALARETVPEWTDHTEGDLGVLLVELFAHACDITLYYQTRAASNLLLATADEPDALVLLLRLIGYELRPPSPATANLRLAFDATEPTPIVVPAATQFFVSLPTGEQLTFETERDLRIENAQLTPPDVANRRYFFPAPVVEGQSVINEIVGISDGSPNQIFRLQQAPVIANSVRVTVTEPAGDTRWQVVETLANSSPADRHCVAQRDAAGGVTLVFGDGTNALIPLRGTVILPVTIKATYRVGGGPRGNIPANSRFNPSIPLIKQSSAPADPATTNPVAASGGRVAEDGDRARTLAPRLFRTQERAVTRQDYVDLALQVDGVGKALAVSLGWNQVVLYVAPSGQVAEPSELLKRDLLAFFEGRRMSTTPVTIVGPAPADIFIAATVQAQPYFLQSTVQAAVEQAIADYLAFENVEFGQKVFLSKVYDVIQSLPQVASLLVTRFSRDHAGGIDADGTIELASNELPRPGYRDNLAVPPPDPARPGFRPPIFAIIEGGVAG